MLFKSSPIAGQNSMIGDGFGGLSGYIPSNYNVGSYSAYAVCPAKNNQLYVWGSNNSAQLGNGTVPKLQNPWDEYYINSGSNTPVAVPGMDHVKYYSTGYLAVVIKNDGSAWAWGDKYDDGEGLTFSPEMYMTDVKYADAGATHVLFVKNDGTVWSAGNNSDYFFGPGSTAGNKITTPFQMPGINSAVRAAVGAEGTGAISVVLLSDGTVKYTAGIYSYLNPNIGQYAINVPVTAPGLSGIVDVKANRNAAYALKNDGTVYSWGAGHALGRPLVNGENINIIPGKIEFPFTGGGSKIIAISATDDGVSALALDDKGNVYGWGINNWGELGIGNTTGQLIPVLVATGAIDILMGETFAYIVKEGNKLFASGMSFSYNYIFYSASAGGYSNDNVFMDLPNKPLLTYTQINPESPDWANPTMCPVVVMPLRLTDFNVAEQAGKGVLGWNTSNEEGTSHFLIERSTDGKNFIEIGKVQASGTGNNDHTYSFTDAATKNEPYYYRLKIVDSDGKYIYSTIRLLNFSNVPKILIYPNPVSSLLTVTGLQGGCQLKVVNVDGRLIKYQTSTGNTANISLGTIPAGIYILQVIRNGSLTNVLKFTKQ